MTSLKFTDRDVRENPDLYLTVVDYLEQYEGEFEFLISCKMRIETGVGLTVGMVRGVLNCMRADPRVIGLPEPLPVNHQAKVIQMRRPKKTEKQDCPLKVAGIFHHHKRSLPYDKFNYCYGLYRINRSAYTRPLMIHDGVLAVGKSPATVLVHRVVSGNAEWLPPAHEEGWLYRKYGPTFWIKVGCKYPSYLKDPILLTDKHVLEYNLELIHVRSGERESLNMPGGFYRSKNRELTELVYCERCFGG